MNEKSFGLDTVFCACIYGYLAAEGNDGTNVQYTLCACSLGLYPSKGGESF